MGFRPGSRSSERTSGRFCGLAGLCFLALPFVHCDSINAGPPLPTPQPVGPEAKPFPITLATALKLADANPLDVALAEARLRIACAQLDRANVLWLPTLNVGVDYFRHDGRIQDVQGHVFDTNKSSLLAGAGPTATIPMADALFAPLAARQVVRAREAGIQVARNNSTYAVAEAYFNVQQARGEAAGAEAASARAQDLVRRVEQLAPGIIPGVEINRARAELARRRQVGESAYERWQIASADLNRLLRLDPTTIVDPQEPPELRVDLLDLRSTVDELIPIGLTNRPELAAHQALVEATLARLKAERLRPLVPSLILRGTGSATPGLAGGAFGGGINDQIGNFGARNSVDLQAVWELQNLGFGNRAAVRERDGERRVALIELLRTQDRVAAEVAQSLARAQRAAYRLKEAEVEVQNAVESADKNLQGLGQTRRVGEQITLVFRPQEAAAAIAALDQAYRDYYSAVADGNRAQFALYRALGHPVASLSADLVCMKSTDALPPSPSPVVAAAASEESPRSPAESRPIPVAVAKPVRIIPAGVEMELPVVPDSPEAEQQFRDERDVDAPSKPQNRSRPAR